MGDVNKDEVVCAAKVALNGQQCSHHKQHHNSVNLDNISYSQSSSQIDTKVIAFIVQNFEVLEAVIRNFYDVVLRAHLAVRN